jgi:hypothetical protein
MPATEKSQTTRRTSATTFVTIIDFNHHGEERRGYPQ